MINKISWFLLFFVHHFIRPIWSYVLFGVPYFLYNFGLFVIFRNERIKIIKNKQDFFHNKNLTEFINYWNTNFKGKYKSDGFWGLLDHFNSPFEFFRIIWDCDDASYYPAFYFIKKNNYKSFIIGLYGQSLTSWHYDCVLKIDENKYMLFNQGNCIYGSSIKECIFILGEKWKTFKKCVWWKCFW